MWNEGLSAGSLPPTELPYLVWSSILEKLCPASLSALEAPSTVARHIINAQLICHKACAASGAAWRALASLIQANHNAHNSEETASFSPNSQISGDTSWEEYVANPLHSLEYPLHADVPWDQIVSNPLSLKINVLKEACGSIFGIGGQVSGTKAALVLRLLHYFGIKRACSVLAIVFLAVKYEKIPYTSTQLKQYPDSGLASAVLLAYHHFTQSYITTRPRCLLSGKFWPLDLPPDRICCSMRM